MAKSTTDIRLFKITAEDKLQDVYAARINEVKGELTKWQKKAISSCIARMEKVISG